MARLIVIRGADEGKQFDLNRDRLQIGRESGNRIRLHDTEVSRKHAEVVRTPEGGFRLVDNGSANGSFVNGRAVQDVLLQPGDQVQIGQTLLLYSAAGSEPAPTSLADRISLITRQEMDLPSHIVKSVNETEGSRILGRPDKLESAWLRANLGVLYEAIQAVSEILDIGTLLERLMELVFKSIPADRGCLLVRPADPYLIGTGGEAPAPLAASDCDPQAVRWRRPGKDPNEKIPLSRTIVEHVLHERAGILVSDAARDARFQAVQSLVRSGVREVICVPMRGRHNTLGVLYLDCVTPARELVAAGLPGKFNEDHLSLAIALAHQAALAIEDTRYHHAMLQAERLAAIGQTMAALSHDIKNILQGLRSGGDILKMGIDDTDPTLLRQGWRIIEKNQNRIYDLVRDMLSYSKDREPNIEPVDLNCLMDEVIELLAVSAEQRGITLCTAPDDGLPSCPADPEGVHRALLNIVGNALDAVEDREEGARVVVATLLEPGGEWVRIEVRDNGPGIPFERLADLFRPFVSTKGGKGTGLGLPVSRKILREHGGDIVVTSTPGEGSIFALRLPLKSPIVTDPSVTSEFSSFPPPDAN